MATKLTDKQKSMLGSAATGLASGIGLGTSLAQIDDTSGQEALIEGVGSTQFAGGDTNTLLSSFDANNMARTNYTADEIRGFTPGQMAGNIIGSTATSMLGSNSFLEAGVRGGLTLAGGIFGALAGNAKAQKRAAELNSLAEENNRLYLNNFANAASNTQNKMFNNSLLNIAAYGGPLFNHGGDWSNGLTFINEGGLHEQNPLGGVPVGIDSEGTPNLVEEGEIIWNDYVFSNRLKPTKKQLETAGFDPKYEGYTFAKIVEDMQKASAENPLDKISTDTLNENLMYLMTMQEEIRMKKVAKQNNKFARGGKVNILNGTANSQSLLGLFPLNENIVVEDIPIEIEDEDIDTSYELPVPQYMHVNNGKVGNISEYEFKKRLEDGTAVVGDKYKPKNRYPWQSNLRYASPLIHGTNLLTNLKKPDYSNADKIESAARAIPGGSFTPIGDYLDLQEIDRNLLVNPILANAAANRRVIQNQGVNAGQAIAGLVANNYNTNNAIGNALIQGIQANNQIKSAEAQFNRGTNQANSQMGLQALTMDQQRAQNILNATVQAGQSRDQLDTMRSQAISSSLTGIADDLGSIGREFMDRALMEKLINSGALRWVKPTAKNGGMLTRNRRRK